MCGIAAIYAFSPAAQPVSEVELTAIRDRMERRGPDAALNWIDADRRVGLAHRRLAIIDLSEGGIQPMHDATGLSIVFNGEIYNYRALRAELEAQGLTFQTASDTEVILRAYRQWGTAMLGRLRGMFALAIWDARASTMLIARDSFGIKPLYYADCGGTLRVASSVKALLAGGAISRQTDSAAEVGFYLTGSIPEPFTAYRDIRALPAGHWAIVTPDGMGTPNAFSSVADAYLAAESAESGSPQGLGDIQQLASAALRDSVAHHMIADVPVGAFLSAGVDSGAILGLVRDAGIENVHTLTLGYAEYAGRHDDEVPLAAMVARHYGYHHHVHVVDKAEFDADLPQILQEMDQPTIDGINTWFVSKATSALGLKAALSGLGGDELLGGYPSFRSIPQWVGRLGPMGSLLRHTGAFGQLARLPGLNRFPALPKGLALAAYGHELRGAYLVRRGLYMPAQLPSLMDPERAREGMEQLNLLDLYGRSATPCPATWFGRVATLETANYMRNQLLRDTDWASMAHSLEVRVPLVDMPLLSAIAPLMVASNRPDGKALLANAPRNPLPSAVANRTKTGFSIPFGRWAGISAGDEPATPYAHLRAWAKRIGQTVFHD